MKKLFISIALVLTALFCCSGCLGCGSCGGESVSLAFSNAWSNNSAETIGLSETLTYDVTYEDNLTIGKAKLTNAIDPAKFDFKYTDGKYETTIKILKAEKSLLKDFDGNTVESEILNEIVDSTDQNTVRKLFQYKTRLDIKFSYKYGDMTDFESKPEADYIESETYFLLVGNSLAPVYTKNTTRVSAVTVGKEISVYQQYYQTSTVYNKKSLETKTIVYHTENGDGYVVGDIASQKTITTKYSFKSVVDNNTLLFAFRTMNIDEGANALSVYSHVYGKPKTINVGAINPSAEKFNINLNGTQMPEEEIQLNGYSFVLNTASGCTTGPNTGRAQYFYTNRKVESAPNSIGSNRTIIMRYVEPLMEYGNYTPMGSLLYTLKSINY